MLAVLSLLRDAGFKPKAHETIVVREGQTCGPAVLRPR